MLISIFLFATSLAATQDGFHLVPISKHTSSLEKRSDDGYMYGALDNQVQSYYAFPQFGETLQTIMLYVDTAAWDTYVYGLGSGASYEYDNSSATDMKSKFYTGFSSQWVRGNYVEDNITWGGSSIKFQFGYVPKYDKSHMPGHGGLGLTFSGRYSSYPFALREQGAIATAAFSMFLDSKNGKNANLLFGAIDTSKYTGELKTVNMTAHKFEIAYSIANVSGRAGLDSGTSYTTLPQAVVEAAAESLNATWNEKTSHWDYSGPGKPTNNLTVSFTGFDLHVPYTEIWRQYSSVPGYYLSFKSGGTIFGDDFLRAWYVVYDLDNKQISLGQASYNSEGKSEYIIIQPSGVQASLK